MTVIVRDGKASLKCSHKVGVGRNELEISAPHPLKNTYQMTHLSAKSIAMVITFKALNAVAGERGTNSDD
jgi:hypothetical protein